jgi:ribonucleoside-triphosphate reductase
MKVIKKDGTIEQFDGQKIVNAVSKSAARAMIKLDDTQYHEIVSKVMAIVTERFPEQVHVADMHNIVEQVLDEVNPKIAKSYRDYRNFKKDFVHIMDEVYQKSQSIRFLGDKENANTDSTLVATKRCLIFNELNKRLYRKFFMTNDELQACKDGFIYIHDQSARLDTMNCCLCDISSIMSGGFEMGNVWYNEPKTLDTAFDVLGDIILATASQQYGGFTVPEVDKILAPYAEKSYKKYCAEYMEIRNQQTFTQDAKDWAMSKVQRDFEQGFQGIEMKLNTVGSSRGDYPFITMTFGLATDVFGKMASKTFLKVHMEGEGKPGFKKPVLFPKLVFLYDESIHGEGGFNEDVFEAGIDCSSKTMYPDWLSLTGAMWLRCTRSTAEW